MFYKYNVDDINSSFVIYCQRWNCLFYMFIMMYNIKLSNEFQSNIKVAQFLYIVK